MKPAGRNSRAAILAALVLSAVAACSPRPLEDLRIGVLADLNTTGGPLTVEAARLAADEINHSGGLVVDGEARKVQLFVQDTEGRPAAAMKAARALVSQSQVHAIVGPNISSAAMTAASVAEAAKVPMISPASTHPGTTADKRYVFRVAFADPFQGQIVAELAAADMKLSSAAVLYNIANPSSRAIAESFRQRFVALGGRVDPFEYYTGADSDFTAAVARIRDAAPGLVFLPNFTDEAIAQVRAIRQLGLQAVVVGSDGWSPQRIIKHDEMIGTFLCHHWDPQVASGNLAAQRFLQAYSVAYGRRPAPVAALTYDAFGLLFEAARRADSLSPKLIRGELARVERYHGVTGTISFAGGGDPHRSAVILKVEPGRVVLYKIVTPAVDSTAAQGPGA